MKEGKCSLDKIWFIPIKGFVPCSLSGLIGSKRNQYKGRCYPEHYQTGSCSRHFNLSVNMDIRRSGYTCTPALLPRYQHTLHCRRNCRRPGRSANPKPLTRITGLRAWRTLAGLADRAKPEDASLQLRTQRGHARTRNGVTHAQRGQVLRTRTQRGHAHATGSGLAFCPSSIQPSPCLFSIRSTLPRRAGKSCTIIDQTASRSTLK